MYFLILYLICIFWFIEILSRSRNKTIKGNIKYINQLLVIVFAIILIGFRDISIGTDTIAYYNRFLNFKNMKLIDVLSIRFPEYGSAFIYWAASKFKHGFRILLIIQAVFYIFVINKVIKKYSASYWLSLLLFILMGFFTFGFSTMDQTIAITFTTLAFIQFEEQNKMNTIGLLVLAVSFHFSAIIFTPLLLFRKIKFNRNTIVLWVGTLLLVFVFDDTLMEILKNYGERYNKNFEITDMKGYLSMLYYSLSAILGIILRKRFFHNNETNKDLLIMVMIAAVILPITLFHPAVPRLLNYYTIFMIIYIPNLVYSIRDTLTRNLIKIGFITITIYVAFTQVFTLSKNIMPYSFFW